MKRKNAYILFDLNETSYTYRGVTYLLFGYFGALFFAALLTPPVHHLIAWGAEAFPDSLFTYLESKHIRKSSTASSTSPSSSSSPSASSS